MRPETLAIHAGYEIDPTTGALTPPIHLSTTFERDADGSFSRGLVYTRDSNPNRLELESRLAVLEVGGSKAFAFASGSVAFMSILQALKTGDHVIAPNDMYFGIQVLLREVFGDWGLEVTFVTASKLDEIKAAVRPNTKLIIIETPSNPQMNLTDIAGTAAIAHEAGALLVCDNTIASPIFQHPFELGADIVVHATTKYLGGHSDVLGGAVIVKEMNPIVERLERIQKIGGAVPSAFDCWLLLRGIFTLPHRMRAINASALAVAQCLAQHHKIERVLHIGLEQHPHFELGQSQMVGYGGLFSFLVRGGQEEAMAVAAKLQLIKRATSFGGVHSTIEHRASIETGTTTPRNLLRLSVGLEHPDDIIEDLEQALG
jgi:cystathionine gamma-synthase